MASPYQALKIWVKHSGVKHFCEWRATEKQQRPDHWQGCLYCNHLRECPKAQNTISIIDSDIVLRSQSVRAQERYIQSIFAVQW